MKMFWTILGTLTATSLCAQISTNSLPAIPAPVSSPAAETAPASAPANAGETTTVNTPAATPSSTAVPTPPKHKKHHVAKKKPAKPEPSVTLAPGAAQVSVSELIVRGQAGLKGEMVAHVYKGDTVTVLEQINLAHHEADEPAQWAKISYPTNAHVWVDAKYVDTNGIVTAKKLNLRAGRGENYSVVGVVEKGTQLTVDSTEGDWIRIEPPANAYAFVAAKYLTQQAAPPAVVAAPPEVPEAPPVSTPVPEQPQIVTQPAPETPPQAPSAPAAPSVRIVSHEGVVGGVGSMTAPTDFKLYDPNTKVDIDYLFVVPGSSIDLSKLVDAQVIVTGEEGISQGWPNTPVMAIQSIQVISTNAIKRFNRVDLTSPRQRH